MPTQRNVVIITIDSLRADYCGYMGHEKNITPALDQLAREGLAFENAVAPAPATGGSVPAIFTGEFQSIDSDQSTREKIRNHMTTNDSLAERFSRRGYNTIGFSTNPWMSRYCEFNTGFDYFEDFLFDKSADNADGFTNAGSLTTQLRNWWNGNEMFMSWESFYDDIIDKYNETESPYFLWVFLVDPHMPYLPGDGYRTQPWICNALANLWLFSGKNSVFEPVARKILLEAYENAIRYTDAFLETLLTDLDDDPLVVVHGDHGEEFGEHDFYGHGLHLYEESIHVPLVIGNAPTDTISTPFSLRKLPKLVTDLADGKEFEIQDQLYIRSKNSEPKYAIQGHGWKYIQTPSGEELYQLEDGVERKFDHTGLRELCRSIVERWEADNEERNRIAEAVTEVVEAGRV